MHNVALTSRVPSATCRTRRGLGLFELLACLSISSMLLTAVAVAYKTSFNSYRDSQQRGQMLNSGRGVLSMMVGDIRRADAAGPYDPSSTVTTNENTQFNNQIVPGTPNSGMPSSGGSGVIGIQLAKTHPDSIDLTASVAHPVLITYWFSSATQQVLMTRQTSATPVTPQVVGNFVQNMQIYMQPVYVPANPSAGTTAGVVLQRAVITLTLANKDANGKQIIVGGQDLTLTLSDAAMPRKNFSGL